MARPPGIRSVRPNTGVRPEEAKGKRVRVVLERDRDTMTEPTYANESNPMAAPGWAADTVKWAKTGSPFDVAFYEVIR